MKNPHIESRKQRAKLYHRNKRGDEFTDGIIVRYLYTDMTPDTLTFWDDAIFIVNDYRVAMSWTHPRYRYRRLVYAEARRRVAHLHPERDRFDNITPNYQKIGRSRKKIVSWTQWPTSDESSRYFELLSDMQRQVSLSVAFEVRPSLAVFWNDSSKSMNLCVP